MCCGVLWVCVCDFMFAACGPALRGVGAWLTHARGRPLALSLRPQTVAALRTAKPFWPVPLKAHVSPEGGGGSVASANSGGPSEASAAATDDVRDNLASITAFLSTPLLSAGALLVLCRPCWSHSPRFPFCLC